MNNFPIGSSISGHYIHHEGNHDHRGTPHEQYLSKWNYVSTTNNKTNVNKWTKIAEINYERDNNVTMHYILKIVSEKTAERYFVNLVVGSSGVNRMNYYANDVFQIGYIYTGTTVGTILTSKVEVYVNLFKEYNPLYVNLEFAINTDNTRFKKDYAFTCVEMLSSQPLLDSVTDLVLATDLTPINVVKSQTWGTTSISANSTYTITINDSNILRNSIVNYTISKILPDGLIISAPQLKEGGGTFYIKVHNVTSGSLLFPSCTIAWRITQL